jgi:hypothetical protein
MRRDPDGRIADVRHRLVPELRSLTGSQRLDGYRQPEFGAGPVSVHGALETAAENIFIMAGFDQNLGFT